MVICVKIWIKTSNGNGAICSIFMNENQKNTQISTVSPED